MTTYLIDVKLATNQNIMTVQKADDDDMKKFLSNVDDAIDDFYMSKYEAGDLVEQFIDTFVDNHIDFIEEKDSFYTLVSEDDLVNMLYAIVFHGMTYYLQQYGYGSADVIHREARFVEEVARTQEQFNEDKVNQKNCASNGVFRVEVLELQTLREQIQKINIPKQEKVTFYEKTRKKIGTS